MPSRPHLRDLSPLPLVVAPMAGGPSTPALVVAAAAAGAIGFLAAGYKSAAALVSEVAQVRAATTGPFGVNVFVPGEPTAEPEALASYLEVLEGEAGALGARLGDAQWDDDAYPAKLAALLADPPPIVSFTFGCPSQEVVTALQGAGTLVAVTVTTPAEAALAHGAGVDCLCLQGAEAGAHRGSFTNDANDANDANGANGANDAGDAGDAGSAQDYPLATLLAEVPRHSDLPLIAAGGIAGPEDAAAALAAGATQVQLGTAFLRCAESGAHPLYKDALGDAHFSSTAITRAFSGRRARSLVNEFVRAHEGAPAAYPEVNNATRPLRAAAAAAGDPERMSLFAGIGFRRAEPRPAAEIIERLAGVLAGPR